MCPDHCVCCGRHLPACWPPLCALCLLTLRLIPYSDWPRLEPPYAPAS